MNSAIIKSFVDFWNGIHSFGKDGSIVAALGLLSAALGLYAGVKGIIDKALQTSAGKIEDLEHDIASRNTKLEDLRAKLRASEEHGIFLQNRLVDTALNGFEKETAEGNHSPANERLVGWIGREGRYIAELLRHRADWALRHASPEVRATALVAARAYLVGALTLDPSNIETATTLASVEFLLAEEGWSSRHTAEALNNLDANISESFDVDLFREADEAEIEADKLIEKSRWRLALPLIQRAVFARSTTIGPTAITTLRVRQKEAFLLNRLGHSSKALPIAKETLLKRQQHLELGPSHLDTLATQYLVAQILNALGRSEEALHSAQETLSKAQQHPDLGSSHPNTLTTQYLVAQILDRLGRSEKALSIAKEILLKSQQHLDLGPSHSDTLRAQHLVARILHTLGWSEVALHSAQETLSKEQHHIDLGPSHPDTLRTQHLVAQILDTLGRSEKALQIAQETLSKERHYLDLGPYHPDTLGTQYLVAQILHTLGRSEEALPIAQETLSKEQHHIDIGLSHPDSLKTQHLVAQILHTLGRNEEK
jgi:tetratricopeptide (TPR) repeat protein